MGLLERRDSFDRAIRASSINDNMLYLEGSILEFVNTS
jgi:hypothetical protein